MAIETIVATEVPEGKLSEAHETAEEVVIATEVPVLGVIGGILGTVIGELAAVDTVPGSGTAGVLGSVPDSFSG